MISQDNIIDTGLVQGTAPFTTTIIVGTPMAAPPDGERSARGNSKMDSLLNQLLTVYHRGGLAETQDFAAIHGIVLEEDLVQVELMVVEETAVSDLEETIKAVGGKYQGHHQTLIQALIPIDALETLAKRSDVLAIRLPRRPALVP
jgi:hypothetical protein